MPKADLEPGACGEWGFEKWKTGQWQSPTRKRRHTNKKAREEPQQIRSHLSTANAAMHVRFDISFDQTRCGEMRWDKVKWQGDRAGSLGFLPHVVCGAARAQNVDATAPR